MPVQRATTSAMSSASTSSLRKTATVLLVARSRSARFVLGRAAVRARGSRRSAARRRAAGRLRVRPARPRRGRRVEAVPWSRDSRDRLLLGFPLLGHLAARVRSPRPRTRSRRGARWRRRPSPCAARLSSIFSCITRRLTSSISVGTRVDLDAQPRGRLVDQVDRLVGQEAVGDVAVARAWRRRSGRCPGCGRRDGPRSAPSARAGSRSCPATVGSPTITG